MALYEDAGRRAHTIHPRREPLVTRSSSPVKEPPGTVLVVGGGVFGVSAALELKRRGWSVRVLDPGPVPHPCAASTDVSKVVRMDYGDDRFYHELGELALDGWDRWNRDWPRPLYHEDGFLILAPSLMAAGGYEHDSYEVLKSRGFTPARLDESHRTLRYPEWNMTRYPDGYFNPRAGWAESGAVVERLAELCLDAGVTFSVAALEELMSEGSVVRGVVTTEGHRIEADRVVVATGAWTPTLLPWLTDVLRSTGHPVLHFQVDDPDAYRGDGFPPWAADISGSGWYGFPALPNGRVKVAHHGMRPPVHPDARGAVSEDHEARTRAFLRQSIPRLAEAPIVHRRICMYCDSYDGDLFIAEDPAREGLVVASGGSGHAFKFAPVLGAIVADVLEERDNRFASRFAWRRLGRVKTEQARYTGA